MRNILIKTKLVLVVTLTTCLGLAVLIFWQMKRADRHNLEDVGNSATQYIEAFHAFSANREPPNPLEMSPFLPVIGEATMPPPGTPMPQDQLSVVDKYVALNAKSLSLLHEAAALKRCRWPLEYDDPSSIFTLRLLGQTRHGVRLLYLEAAYRAQTGKYDLAAHSILASFALSHSLTALNQFSAEMTRFACENLTLAGLEQTLNLGPISDAELAKLEEAISLAEASVNLPKSSVPQADVHRILGLWRSHLRLAQAVIAIERFRSVEGKLPDDMSELVPLFLTAIPIDPFDEHTIRYRRSEKGYVVYGTDPDRLDQGGLPDTTTNPIGGWSFTVEREEVIKNAQN